MSALEVERFMRVHVNLTMMGISHRCPPLKTHRGWTDWHTGQACDRDSPTHRSRCHRHPVLDNADTEEYTHPRYRCRCKRRTLCRSGWKPTPRGIHCAREQKKHPGSEFDSEGTETGCELEIIHRHGWAEAIRQRQLLQINPAGRPRCHGRTHIPGRGIVKSLEVAWAKDGCNGFHIQDYKKKKKDNIL